MQGWSLKTFRRLKNVIILLDVTPDVGALTFSDGATQFGRNLNATQDENLRKAFRMFDVDNDDQLTIEEAEAFVESLDLDVNREQFSVRSVLERIDAAKSGRISYDQAKQVYI